MRFAALFLFTAMIAFPAISESATAADDIQHNIAWGEAAFPATGAALPPIAFVYGGRPSSELLPAWTRSVEAEVADGAMRKRTVVYHDPASGFEVRIACRIYLDTAGVDWTIFFANRGNVESLPLEHVRALATAESVGADAAVTLHQLRGSTAGATDWEPFDTPLSVGARVDFAPQNGRSSKEACPFFTCAWPGGGVVTAIGWTGRWNASVHRENDTLRIEAGLQSLRTTVRPGESIRGPRILQLRYTGEDPWRGYNAFRQTLLRHISPRIDGQPVTPPIAHLSTAFYEMDDGTEADVLSHLASTRGLGFEYFWLDAYRGRERFPTIGNYVLPVDREVDKTRFPRGLAPIGQAARDAGMKFLLWFEPERIAPGTLMATEHPDWVLMPPPDRMGYGGMLRMDLPEVRDYTTRYLDTAVKEYGIDCLRIDNAVDYGVTWSLLDEADPARAGLAEIRYVESLYQQWDELLAANPGVFIDNCASGGQRIDLETCARSIPLWRTDGTIGPLLGHDYNEAAIRNQVITAGLSRYLPYHTSGQMGATPYLFRSGFNAGASFCEDIRAADYPRELLAQGIAEGKRIRKYYAGNFYTLSPISTDPAAWCVLQYHRPAQGDGMILAFRRHAAPEGNFPCAPREIEPAAAYEVTRSPGYVPESAVRMSGADLAGLTLEIAEQPGALLLEYRRVD
ncbi:MAG: alpha-galactosidase [Candidatus Hydrogenedentes bacterium]|nr:alpha-galactosidase [Candidatus Hydrogenedentota bacterium]